jgi:hypothetical protein
VLLSRRNSGATAAHLPCPPLLLLARNHNGLPWGPPVVFPVSPCRLWI